MNPSLKTVLKGSRSIVRVNPDHYPQLTSWYKGRGQRIDLEDSISDMGYIADGRVAGWLYITNSNCAMIEGLIADPNSLPSLRRASMRKLVGFLIDTALMLGFTNIFAISKHPSVAQLSKEFGFKVNDTLKVYTLNTGRD